MYRKIGRNEKIRGKVRKKGEKTKRAIKVKISNKYVEFLGEESVFKGEKVFRNKHHRNHEHFRN